MFCIYGKISKSTANKQKKKRRITKDSGFFKFEPIRGEEICPSVIYSVFSGRDCPGCYCYGSVALPLFQQFFKFL